MQNDISWFSNRLNKISERVYPSGDQKLQAYDRELREIYVREVTELYRLREQIQKNFESHQQQVLELQSQLESIKLTYKATHHEEAIVSQMPKNQINDALGPRFERWAHNNGYQTIKDKKIDLSGTWKKSVMYFVEIANEWTAQKVLGNKIWLYYNKHIAEGNDGFLFWSDHSQVHLKSYREMIDEDLDTVFTSPLGNLYFAHEGKIYKEPRCA